MASDNTTGTATCPVCRERLTFPVSAAYLSTTEVAVSCDLAPVRAHIDGHRVQLTTGLPAAAVKAPTTVDVGLPVQCWHTEPGSPCDWDACRQPDRLASGDAGSDPADHQ